MSTEPGTSDNMASMIAVSTAAESLPAESERQLVERAQRDPQALAVLYRTHYAAIASYVVRRVGDRHEADDLVADVFLAMVRYLPRYRWSGAPFRSWLYRLATTQVNRWARRRRHWAKGQLAERALVEAQPAQEQSCDTEAVQWALLALAPRYQAVLSLHYLQDMPLAEIATVLGCRVGTVKSRLSRGREALRKLLAH